MKCSSALVVAAALVVTAAAAPAQAPPEQLDAHYVSAATEYFVAEGPFEGGYQYVSLARMVTPPTSTSGGEAEFLGVGGPKAGQRFWSRYYWRTRPASLQEVVVGRLAFCADLAENDVYRAPRGRGEATQTSWFMGTVVDISYLHRQQVILDQYRASPSCLRVPLDRSDTLPPNSPPTLDAQSVDSADYFVRSDEYQGGYGGYVALARMIRPPTSATGGEAMFMALQSHAGYRSGQRFWTRYFWKTRTALPADVRVGTTVLVFDAADHNVYRAPRDRFEAVLGSWWMGAVTDLTAMHRQEVGVGDYQVRPNALRVSR
jgi:hypothetical protein